jgi:hypothetical protein
VGELRESQLQTLKFAAQYPDGIGFWELASFGPGGHSIRSAEHRLGRLEASGHVRYAPFVGRMGEEPAPEIPLYVLTDAGRQALAGEQDKAGRDAS